MRIAVFFYCIGAQVMKTNSKNTSWNCNKGEKWELVHIESIKGVKNKKWICFFWLAWQNNPTVQLFHVWYVYLLLLTACYKPHWPVLWKKTHLGTRCECYKPAKMYWNVQKFTYNQCKESINNNLYCHAIFNGRFSHAFVSTDFYICSVVGEFRHVYFSLVQSSETNYYVYKY